MFGIPWFPLWFFHCHFPQVFLFLFLLELFKSNLLKKKINQNSFFRYLNVLLKEFAHSAEMLLTAFLTAAFFGTPLTINVLISIFLVGVSIYLYNKPQGFFFLIIIIGLFFK